MLKKYLLIIFISFSLSAKEIETIDNLKVIKVIDGDTITVVSKEGDNFKIRLLGIQAPELNAKPVWNFAQESKDALSNILSNKIIKITYVKNNKTDRYQRVLADIWDKNNLWINGYMVEQGLAFTYILNNDKIPKIKELLALENKAINNKTNIWSLKEYQIISPLETLEYLGFYKIVEGRILNIIETKHSIWLSLEEKGNKGFSIRVAKKDKELIDYLNTMNLKNKRVKVRGFIERYSNKYGALIHLKQKNALEILN